MENLFFIILAALSLFVFFKLGKVKASKKQTLVVISGDRHKAGIYKQDNLYELTSSSLNKPLPRWVVAVWNETDPLLLGKMHYDMNYGLISINSSGTVNIDLKDDKGNILEAVEFDL